MKILITGPESTGKSVLATRLSEELGIPLIAEYARSYLTELDRPYNSEDIELMARHHIDAYDLLSAEGGFVMDTWLLNMRIWMLEKFGAALDIPESEIRRRPFDHIFLCYPDIPWMPDPLRESGGKRLYLFEAFEKELNHFDMPYKIVKGSGNQRFRSVINAL